LKIALSPDIRSKKDDFLCYHCGDNCHRNPIIHDQKAFCCNGCKTVYEILSSNQLFDYYQLENAPGLSQKKSNQATFYDYLDNESIKNQLLDFASEEYEKISLTIPNIHCSSCIWLLENLNRLQPAILDSKVNFTQKQLVVHYTPKEISLKGLAEMLASIGYSPSINLEDSEEQSKQKSKNTYNKKLIIKLGVAGFCFGNVMLLSFPDYLGLTGIEKQYTNFFRYLNMLLAIPVVFYAGSEYLISAFKSLKQRFTNIDVPIALGVIVLFFRSSFEVLTGSGPGYFDSLTGLIFFLLIGKWFQTKTYEALSFERDYKSYFPLAIQKLVNGTYVSTPVKELKKGDEILVRNNEIIPGDAILITDKAAIDYSFVTGESDPVAKVTGDYIYAGGRQVGSNIKLVIQKEISQSYLTELWNNKAFKAEKPHVKLVDKISRYFTLVIIVLAVGGALFWQIIDPEKTWVVFTAVLIVACPCALALSTPFTVGSVMRVFGKNKFYLKNADVVEKISSINTLVFDKTGTLTSTEKKDIVFIGDLSISEKALIAGITANSTHPLSKQIHQEMVVPENGEIVFNDYEEIAGKGLIGKYKSVNVKIGSANFTEIEQITSIRGAQVFVLIDGKFKGYFELKTSYRSGLNSLIQKLSASFNLSVLSGDNESEKRVLGEFFPEPTKMYFNQNPSNKLEVIKAMQAENQKVLMLGDGLNDAGALMQSDIGVAVTEDTSYFSPASDAILEAGALEKMDKFLSLGSTAKKIIITSFVLSFLYNIGGVTLALTGQLTPLLAAILMPLSSITIVVFTTTMVRLMANKLKLD